jgi:hypothetical protein
MRKILGLCEKEDTKVSGPMFGYQRIWAQSGQFQALQHFKWCWYLVEIGLWMWCWSNQVFPNGTGRWRWMWCWSKQVFPNGTGTWRTTPCVSN